MSRKRRSDSSKPASTQPSSSRFSIGVMAVSAVALAAISWGVWQGFRPVHSTEPALESASSKPGRDHAVFAAYAGSASCRECHGEIYQLWKDSHHALAERDLDPALDHSAFDPAQLFQHGTQVSEARVNEEGRYELVTLGPGNEKQAFPLERVIGVAPLRQFLVEAPGGRMQVTEVAADPVEGDWFNIFGDEDRQPHEWGHWTGRGMNWNSMCAACHNTRVQKNYVPDLDVYHTTMAERAIGCESCHGPKADHVAWQRKTPAPPQPDPTLRRFEPRQVLDTCASCHSRRAELTGDFQPGHDFFDHYLLTIPNATDTYYPDGQVRDENFEFASFLGSRMHAAGVRCLDCHEPHSAKLRMVDNSLCMRCHGAPVPPAPKIDPALHSFHQPETPGGRCVDCHMPITVYMERHPRRDHSFTSPDPLLTRDFGIPNACNSCHSNQTVDWAIETVEKWYGPLKDRPAHQRARAVAEARDGRTNAHQPLLRLLEEESLPLWRGVAVELLAAWSLEPAVLTALLEAASDPEPLVRSKVVRSLEGPVQQGHPAALKTVTRMLRDPVRAVRVEAAWVLRSRVDVNSAAAGDLLHYLEHNLDQPSGLFQKGVWLLDRGDLDSALARFQRAVEWDGGSPPLREALAIVLSRKGRLDDAVLELEAACRLDPVHPEYRFKLGLALNEAGRLDQAVAALEETVKLDPAFAQAWYNLGLAYSAREQLEPAVEALLRAEALVPGSAQFPYARATIHARLGQIEEARNAARRALSLQPNHRDAAGLLRTLGR